MSGDPTLSVIAQTSRCRHLVCLDPKKYPTTCLTVIDVAELLKICPRYRNRRSVISFPTRSYAAEPWEMLDRATHVSPWEMELMLASCAVDNAFFFSARRTTTCLAVLGNICPLGLLVGRDLASLVHSTTLHAHVPREVSLSHDNGIVIGNRGL